MRRIFAAKKPIKNELNYGNKKQIRIAGHRCRDSRFTDSRFAGFNGSDIATNAFCASPVRYLQL